LVLYDSDVKIKYKNLMEDIILKILRYLKKRKTNQVFLYDFKLVEHIFKEENTQEIIQLLVENLKKS
jgi:hypothetical protein